MAPSEQPKVAIFLHAGDYDRIHQGLAIAAAAVSSNRRVDVFFFWWALERLVKGELDEPSFSPPRDDVSDVFEKRRVPTVPALIEVVRQSGLGTIYGCTGSAQLVDLPSPKLERAVDQLVGWSTILKLTAGVVDRFYL